MTIDLSGVLDVFDAADESVGLGKSYEVAALLTIAEALQQIDARLVLLIEAVREKP